MAFGTSIRRIRHGERCWTKYYDQPPFPFVPGYDLVGTVTDIGPGVDPALLGRRVAALTKVGGWSSHVVLDAAYPVLVPDARDFDAAPAASDELPRRVPGASTVHGSRTDTFLLPIR